MMLSNEQKDSIITSLERIAADLDIIAQCCDWVQHNGREIYLIVDALQKIAVAADSIAFAKTDKEEE